MLKQKILIQNKLGLHARAAAKFVATTGRYESQIFVRKGNQEVNGKSIMGVMMLAAPKGTELELTVEGRDEQDCLDAIKNLVDNRFEEKA